MVKHILLPIENLLDLDVPDYYKEWLYGWLSDLENNVHSGIICSSSCLQGFISEIVLYGQPQTDWIEILKEYLTDENGEPIAYSENYGNLLYKFKQWKQSPIHAIHLRWYLEKYFSSVENDLEQYGHLIQRYVQNDGWIYNPNVSMTKVRTRMKSELTMSMLMGIEILNALNLLEKYKDSFCCSLSVLAPTTFLGAEYFRYRSLMMLKSSHLAPTGLPEIINSCCAGNGYCDFTVATKVDDYMGTSKRVSRDKTIQSPLLSLFAGYFADTLEDAELRSNVLENLKKYSIHLSEYPFDIPSFKMRDIEHSFGTSITPLEIISSSYLINRFV